MISALDSSVILDVLVGSPHAGTSEALLRRAMVEGKLVIGSACWRKLPRRSRTKGADSIPADWQIEFVPSSCASAMLAGRNFARYLARGGRTGRIVADFLIGAHAMLHADRLLARDRGYLRDYFSRLTILSQVPPA